MKQALEGSIKDEDGGREMESEKDSEAVTLKVLLWEDQQNGQTCNQPLLTPPPPAPQKKQTDGYGADYQNQEGEQGQKLKGC